MSKRRPSSMQSSPAATRFEPDRDLQNWLRRVFHNSYTRGGRSVALRGWSVKLQHARRRRTFSLTATTRSGAAAEARAIYQQLSSEGWEAVLDRYRRSDGRASSRLDPGYWRQRLLVRKYPPANRDQPPPFSVHLEHAGQKGYFHLGTSDPDLAAERGLEIYRLLIEAGWDAVRKTFPREVTLAFHWGFDPLLWTYTTVHTPGFPIAPGESVETPEHKTPVLLLLIESDPDLRDVLAVALRGQKNVACHAFPDVPAARQELASGKPALCLVNRALAASLGVANSNQLGHLSQGTPVVCYTTHPDSEELFALTPGGACAYLLKRTRPENILEPVAGVLPKGLITADLLLQACRTYFQRLFQREGSSESTATAAQFTPREHEVLNLMSKGCVDKEIASVLGISVWTVHEHAKRIFEKLGVHSRTEAVLAYLQK